ncbi:MAG: GAF domain-containing protein [Chloroflexi bacterium]|nr:GAF domain-containing protein [Chloroflexota bacterium]
MIQPEDSKSQQLRHDLRAWLLRPSIRAKIMGIVLALVLLLGLGATWQVRVNMTNALLAQLQERSVSIARDVAAHSTDFILINNTYALHELLQDTIQNNADLRYAFILDANNRVLVHSFDGGFPRGLAEKNSVTSDERAHSVLLQSDEGVIHDIAVPIFEGRAGIARIGLTEASVHRAVNDLTSQMLLTTMMVSLLGVGAAYLLTLILTRPILTLVDVTQAVARGDLTRQAPQWGDDEIGKLSTAFNRMTTELDASQRAILRRNRELAALNAVANAVNAPAPLGETLDRSLRALLDSLDLPASWTFLRDHASGQIELTTWIGLPHELGLREAETALHGCPCTVAITNKQSVVVSPLPERCPLREARTITSHVTVPIVSHERVLGVLGVASGDANAFSPDEVKLLEAVGQELGIAVENARLWDDLREKERVRGQLLEKVIGAQEEERKRIARELHDDTGQAITSLMVGLRAAGDTSELTTRTRLDALREIAAQTLESVKRLARELRPAALDDLGLAAALERYALNYRANYGLGVDLQMTGFQYDTRLTSEIELALYRIIQEALTNVAKHAHAKNVSIVVERKRAAVVAIVEDDGRGFDVRAILESAQDETKLGLHGMRERAELVGGQLKIESTLGKGSSVFVEIPIQ